MSLSTAAQLEDTKARNKELIDEVLEAYPEKIRQAPRQASGHLSKRASPIAA